MREHGQFTALDRRDVPLINVAESILWKISLFNIKVGSFFGKLAVFFQTCSPLIFSGAATKVERNIWFLRLGCLSADSLVIRSILTFSRAPEAGAGAIP